MAIIKEAYSSTRVNLIYQLIKNEAEAGRPKEYDIRVDDLKVVSRNADPDQFHTHEEFVIPETKVITINVYDGVSNRCARYQLMLSEEEQSNQGLSGIENTITARMKQEKSKWELSQLQKDYEDCQQRLKECEQYAEGLQEKVSQLELEQCKNSGQLTNALIGLAGTVLSNNPNALSGIPIIGSLFGGGKQVQAALNGSKQECLCSNAAKTYTGELTVGDDQLLKAALVPYFKEEYREKMMKVLLYFFQYNHFIDQSINGMETLLRKDTAQKTEKKAA